MIAVRAVWKVMETAHLSQGGKGAADKEQVESRRKTMGLHHLGIRGTCRSTLRTNGDDFISPSSGDKSGEQGNTGNHLSARDHASFLSCYRLKCVYFMT